MFTELNQLGNVPEPKLSHFGKCHPKIGKFQLLLYVQSDSKWPKHAPKQFLHTNFCLSHFTKFQQISEKCNFFICLDGFQMAWNVLLNTFWKTHFASASDTWIRHFLFQGECKGQGELPHEAQHFTEAVMAYTKKLEVFTLLFDLNPHHHPLHHPKLHPPYLPPSLPSVIPPQVGHE